MPRTPRETDLLDRLASAAGGSTTIGLEGIYNGSGGLGDETAVAHGDIPVATIVASGHGIVFYYIHTDHPNTPRQPTLPSDNTQMWTWFSDPFGTTAENQKSPRRWDL